MRKRIAGLLLAALLAFSAAAGAPVTAGAAETAAAETAAETVSFKKFSAPADSETLDLGKTVVKGNEFEDFYAFLAQFPNLKKVDMFASTVREEQVDAMRARFPQVEFGWTMKVAGYTVRTDDTSFSTRHGNESTRRGWETYRLLLNCPNLKALDLGHNDIDDLSFLYELPQLKVLILADNKIKDLTPITCQKELEYIELFRNEIEDVTPLAELEHVLDLNLVFNYITDLSPLEGMHSLERLWVNHYNHYNVDVPMDEEMLARLRAALPQTLVDTTAKSPTGNYWRKHPRYDAIARMFRNGGQYEPFAKSGEAEKP